MLKRKCDGYVGRGGKCLSHQSIINKSFYIYLYIYIDIYKHIVKWQLNVNNSIPPPTHTSTQSFAHYIFPFTYQTTKSNITVGIWAQILSDIVHRV